ncbi:hypothetical protein AAVH_30006, partial [Aphelenchoides avenae]
MAATLEQLTVAADGKTAELATFFDFSLKIHLAESFSGAVKNVHADKDSMQVDYESGCQLRVTLTKLASKEDMQVQSYRFEWRKPDSVHYLKDTLFLGDAAAAQWYGGAIVLGQEWPINTYNGYKFTPYVIGDCYIMPSNGQERYWLSSKRIALAVPADVHLWTQISHGYLSLQAQTSDSPYASFPVPPSSEPYLVYELLIPTTSSRDVPLVEFHQFCAKRFLGGPTKTPDKLVVEKPIWTTWCEYGKSVAQADVEEYAAKIKQLYFPISQLELDHKWTTTYGDFEFDQTKFPDFTGMTKKLSKDGIRLTAWVHPFVNVDSNNGKDEALRELFVKTAGGQPEPVDWWNGKGYAVDFTNPKAAAWFESQLIKLQKEGGIYTYKFDAGEVNYLPKDFRLHTGKAPNDYSVAYAELAAKFGASVENRVACKTQHLTLLFRTIDRASTWDGVGLVSLIPEACSLSLHGYYWNLPDIIGGNGPRPDKELFIRWTQ